jgi:hypothetical protein
MTNKHRKIRKNILGVVYYLQHSNGYMPSNSFMSTNKMMGQNTRISNSMTQMKLPFLAMLNLLDFMNLTNDLVLHDLSWLLIPIMLPLDILKFEGKAREDATNHITNFHIWCSSNSSMDDSIKPRIFQ